jgi:hypothetical protein
VIIRNVPLAIGREKRPLGSVVVQVSLFWSATIPSAIGVRLPCSSSSPEISAAAGNESHSKHRTRVPEPILRIVIILPIINIIAVLAFGSSSIQV